MRTIDLIEFTLTAGFYSLSNPKRLTEREATIQAASRAFGFSVERAEQLMDRETRIRCTSAQFGLFIAFRVEEGMQNNRISVLNVRVVPHVVEPDIVDVSNQVPQ